MIAAAQAAAEDLEFQSARYDALDVSETRALLGWMANGMFTFLGYREYRLRQPQGGESLVPVEQAGLASCARATASRKAAPRTLAGTSGGKADRAIWAGHQVESAIDGSPRRDISTTSASSNSMPAAG